jgi:hypothetical protein
LLGLRRRVGLRLGKKGKGKRRGRRCGWRIIGMGTGWGSIIIL